MAKTRILILDADTEQSRSTTELLTTNGFEVSTLPAVKDTRFLKEANPPHLLILDSVELVPAIRKDSQVPILIVSSKSDVADRVQGLEAGADDYLSKPFERRELLARLNSILRRAPGRGPGAVETDAREWRFHGLTVQTNRRRVLVDNQIVELTAAEFDLLRLLVSHAKQPLTRETILEQLRGIEWEAVDRSIDILVSRLRDKLQDDPRRPRFIRTIRSVGYQFVGEPTDPEQPGPESMTR